MPGVPRADDAGSGAEPRMSIRQRLLLAMPKFRSTDQKERLGDRFRKAVLKPEKPGANSSTSKAPQKPMSMEELEAAARSANDKERIIGLIAAPLAAVIGLSVITALRDSGQLNVGEYHDLTLVLLALSVLILAMAWLRKRLYLGIVMALYGLAIFNLHYWGFGIPFLLGGSWYLVRAYRLQRDLREATGQGRRSTGPEGRGSPGVNSKSPRASKRYTPPAPR